MMGGRSLPFRKRRNIDDLLGQSKPWVVNGDLIGVAQVSSNHEMSDQTFSSSSEESPSQLSAQAQSQATSSASLVNVPLIDDTVGTALAALHRREKLTPEFLNTCSQEGSPFVGELNIVKLLDQAIKYEEEGKDDLVKTHQWLIAIALQINHTSQVAKKTERVNAQLAAAHEPSCDSNNRFIVGFGTLPCPDENWPLFAGKYGNGTDLAALYNSMRKNDRFKVMNSEKQLTSFYRKFIHAAVRHAYDIRNRQWVTSRFNPKNNSYIDLDTDTIINFLDRITRAGGVPMWPAGDVVAEARVRGHQIITIQYFLDTGRRSFKAEYLKYATANELVICEDGPEECDKFTPEASLGLSPVTTEADIQQ